MKVRPLPILAVAALALVPCRGAEATLRSPFQPPQAAVGDAAVTDNAPLEFRGIMESNAGRQFLLVDPSRKASTWVGLNQKDNDFGLLVKSFDESNPKRLTVSIEQNGRPYTIALREAKVASAGAAAVPVAAGPGGLPPPNVNPAVTQSVVLSPTAADEQVRLQAVVDEYRRRREQRAAGANGQPVPFAAPPPAAPAVQQAQPAVQNQQGQGNRQQRQGNGGQGGGQRRGN